MVGTTCAFTGHRPHKFPWKDNEADPRFLLVLFITHTPRIIGFLPDSLFQAVDIRLLFADFLREFLHVWKPCGEQF